MKTLFTFPVSILPYSQGNLLKSSNVKYMRDVHIDLHTLQYMTILTFVFDTDKNDGVTHINDNPLCIYSGFSPFGIRRLYHKGIHPSLCVLRTPRTHRSDPGTRTPSSLSCARGLPACLGIALTYNLNFLPCILFLYLYLKGCRLSS